MESVFVVLLVPGREVVEILYQLTGHEILHRFKIFHHLSVLCVLNPQVSLLYHSASGYYARSGDLLPVSMFGLFTLEN